MILSIFAHIIAASRCSVVCIITSFFLSSVLLFVTDILSKHAFIIGFSTKSTLTNLMPEFIGPGLKVSFTSLAV